MSEAQEEAKRRAEIMLAFSEGKEIEKRWCLSSNWTKPASIDWDWSLWEYRIKPEPRKPREIWVNEYDGTGLNMCGLYDRHHGTAEEARNKASKGLIATLKFIEVIEEEQA